jgi:oligoendopeptidase F
MSVQMKEKETASEQTLPHWDMSVVYPGLDSPEFETGFQELVAAIDELAQLFDAHNLGREQAGPMPAEQLDAATIALFEQALAQINQAREQASQMRGYIHGFVSVDSRDALAQAKMSQLQMQQVRIAKLGTRLIAWVGTLPVEALIARS